MAGEWGECVGGWSRLGCTALVVMGPVLRH
jgi:hypothetical protein